MGGKERHDGKHVANLALQLSQYLELTVKNTICGSVRRGRNDVGDIDLVVANLPAAIRAVETFCALRTLKFQMEVELKPMAKVKSVMVANVQVDLYLANEENWGAMTLFLTGSQLFNILTRSHAKKQGMKLSQYGLFFNDEVIAGRTEEQIFSALGIAYMTPAEREMRSGDKLPIIK